MPATSLLCSWSQSPLLTCRVGSETWQTVFLVTDVMVLRLLPASSSKDASWWTCADWCNSCFLGCQSLVGGGQNARESFLAHWDRSF